MKEIVSIMLRVLLVAGIVLAGFWLYKHSTRVTIELDDHSMDPVSFPEGGYTVNTQHQRISSLKSGDVVAYRNPRDTAKLRVARVIGIEGNRIEINKKDVLVDGKPFARRIATGDWIVPEFKVPRGCLYLLADNPFIANDSDSKALGPVPYAYVLGTVKPVN